MVSVWFFYFDFTVELNVFLYLQQAAVVLVCVLEWMTASLFVNQISIQSFHTHRLFFFPDTWK